MFASPVPPITNHYLEVSPPSTKKPRIPQSPSQRLPPTALFHGPNSRNQSRTTPKSVDTFSPSDNAKNASQGVQTPTPQPQHLPRADPPTTSFSGGRPSFTGAPRQQTPNTRARDDADNRADALWAEMQKTLADVELSALNSSHVFSTTHTKALEELRTTQLNLAQAWAKSEAEEMDDENFENEVSIGAMKGAIAGRGGGLSASPRTPARGGHSRASSMKSTPGRNLEEETETDIKLARRRREANDRYFLQVHKGVLDVVSKLDDVANAMRKVEKESRDIWNDDSTGGETGLSDDEDEVGDTDESTKMIDTDTEGLGDSPVSVKTKK